MTVEEEAKAAEKRNVLVGIRIDSHSRELLNWALVKVAEPGDCVIAVHVCRSSGHASKDKPLLDSYLEVYDGICVAKKVELTGRISRGISVRRTLVREAKNFAAVAVVVGLNNQGGLRGWASTARYCGKRLPPTTEVLCIHNGKIVFRRCNNNQLPGLGGDPKPSLNLIERPLPIDVQSEFGDSEADTEISSYEILTRDHESGGLNDETSSLSRDIRRSTCLFPGDILDQRPGWPLLRRTSSAANQKPQGSKMSVVQWAMNLPDRSTQQRPQGLIKESTTKRETSNILKIVNASNCKLFSYKDLVTATSNFHSGLNHVQ